MIRTRFAPSPTGFLHIGSLRTALYSFALAKHFNGKFLLRIEDTDQTREVTGATEGIFSTLNKFGIVWDEEPVIQSQRAKSGAYIQAAEHLVATGNAFYCQCEARNAKTQGYSELLRDPCRSQKFTHGAVKLKVPDSRTVTYHDYVLDKDISWKTDTVADTTLLKSEHLGRLPTYHLAVVVDDSFMNISHALRGHDWLPSTPIHLLTGEFLGLTRPEIGHLTDIQSPKGGKLSKRRDSVFCEKFIEEGYLPEALLNFVLLLGWAPKDNRELYTLDEFVQAFDPKGFQKANPLFLPNKLDWINGQYIRHKSDTQLTHLVKPYVKINITDTMLMQIIPLIKDRLTKLDEINSLLQPFITQPSETDATLFTPNALTNLASISAVVKENFGSLISLNDNFKKEIERLGEKTGNYFMDMRVALMGSRSTPPITESALILGQAEVLKRLETAKKSLTP